MRYVAAIAFALGAVALMYWVEYEACRQAGFGPGFCIMWVMK